jgi:hypothetical protein
LKLKVYNNKNSNKSSNAIPITCIVNRATEHEVINDTPEKHNKQLFSVGDKVEHIEEKINGKVAFIGKTKLAINWEDNTKERYTFDDADKELKLVEAYVDTTETEVNPLESSSSNPEKVEAAIEQNDIDTTIKLDTIDVEKEKLQHKIDKLENKITNNMTANMKEKVANELVDLAISKGMIDADDKDLEIVKLSSLNDEEMRQYEQDVINYSDDGNIVELANEKEKDDDYAGLSDEEIEAKKMLGSLRLKGTAPSTPSVSESSGESRKLSEVKYDSANVDPRTFTNNQNELEESLANYLGSIPNNIKNETSTTRDMKSARKAISRHASIHEQKSLPGFENLQGLKKPLVMGSSEQFKSSNSISDMFKDFNWTTISKK